MMYLTLSLIAAMAPCVSMEGSLEATRTIRVLVVTGGHDFDRTGFDALWRSLRDITVRQVAHPEAHQWFAREKANDYDVIVCYDMHQEIDQTSRDNLVRLLKRGKGLMVLHHALENYQEWDEWHRMAGGRFLLTPKEVNGVRKPASTWKDDVPVRVRVAAPRHPVVRGLTDFDLVDEVYGNLDLLPTVTPLLKTDEPTSHPVIAWAHTYGRSRVVAIQPGHGPSAWTNPSYQKLLYQAIRWVAGSR